MTNLKGIHVTPFAFGYADARFHARLFAPCPRCCAPYRDIGPLLRRRRCGTSTTPKCHRPTLPFKDGKGHLTHTTRAVLSVFLSDLPSYQRMGDKMSMEHSVFTAFSQDLSGVRRKLCHKPM
ncbi:hypothetical protein DQ04_00671240 [Trypanosoma grayi]|uniref:hypothetical protein n=1 Tax=Trypanosoma grayi TaxID=71804 RepID=UPI0004F407CD|nr:hypothetical protein DQ04_00671240 [Trypanosoma grayi]KEG14021.1 hypothetical protein DQ04_00671240 [Trypanosoma grayi]